MKKYIYATGALLVCSLSVIAQSKVKDGTVIGSPSLPNTASVLELESSNKGLLLPRVSLSNTLVWGLSGSAPATGGMTVYNTNASMTGAANAPVISGGVGVYYWNGNRWVAGTGQQKPQADSTYWALHGNAGLTSTATVGGAMGTDHFLGTTGASNLTLGTNSVSRMVIGQNGSAHGGTASITNGSESFTWGQRDTVANNFSAAFGTGNRVSSTGSFAAGTDNKINAGAAFAATFGRGNNDSALFSLMVGDGNTLSQQSSSSSVFGLQNNITNTGGATTSVLGGNLISGGGNLINFDGDSNVSGNYSSHFNIVAGQSNTVVTSANSAIFGYNNDMMHSDGSLVIGFSNRLERVRNSMVMGLQNIDSANQSFVTGQGNVASPDMSWATVVGRFNAPMSNALFTVGNGASGAARSNAFVVSNTYTSGAVPNGLIVLLPDLPTYASDAAAVADASLPAGGLYKIGHDLRIK
jgi:hypothetical protein